MTAMEPGLVSVMMPAYNAERYIRPAMESLLAQTYSRWELIVVNDGSKDATAAIARSFDDPRIRVIDQPNGGEASARNTALRTMRGEFVAFLDADDAYLPEHLETAAGFLVWNKDFDAAYTDGLHCDENGVRLQSLSSRRLSPQDGNIFDQVVRASCMLGPPVCLVLRREPILQRELWFDFAITIGPDWIFSPGTRRKRGSTISTARPVCTASMRAIFRVRWAINGGSPTWPCAAARPCSSTVLRTAPLRPGSLFSTSFWSTCCWEIPRSRPKSWPANSSRNCR